MKTTISIRSALLLSGAVIAGCASTPSTTPATARPAATPPPAATTIDDAVTDVDTPPPPPATWAEALDRYGSSCPAPLFTMTTPSTVTVGPSTFLLGGSTLTRQTPRPVGPLVFAVLGAVKDADDATAENLRKAAAAFKAAGVQFVIANGDLVGDETSALVPVVEILGATFDIPVLAHSGNYEWTSAFTQAMADAATTHPHLVNMNIVRDVDFGGVHVLSLPGYFNRRFIRNGACHYTDDDVKALTAHAQAIAARGEVAVLTSHGPPLGKSTTALDVTNDGENVGDPQINRLMHDGAIHFGVFSHILESGGRALSDVDEGTVVKLPMKTPEKQLAINAGAATSFAWEMVGGNTARGMAAIVTIDTAVADGEASVAFITLR